MNKKVLTVLTIVGMALLALALSWVATAFLYWLITLCFGIGWSILHATGVWLIMILITSCFSGIKVRINQ